MDLWATYAILWFLGNFAYHQYVSFLSYCHYSNTKLFLLKNHFHQFLHVVLVIWRSTPLSYLFLRSGEGRRFLQSHHVTSRFIATIAVELSCYQTHDKQDSNEIEGSVIKILLIPRFWTGEIDEKLFQWKCPILFKFRKLVSGFRLSNDNY